MLGRWYMSGFYPCLRLPICFFSMFAWCPTTPIWSVLSPWSNVFCCFKRTTVGKDCSDWDTNNYLLEFFSSLIILSGLNWLTYFLSVWISLKSPPFFELFDGECSSLFSALFQIMLGLYCYLCWSMIAFINSMSFVFMFSAESSFSTLTYC